MSHIDLCVKAGGPLDMNIADPQGATDHRLRTADIKKNLDIKEKGLASGSCSDVHSVM